VTRVAKFRFRGGPSGGGLAADLRAESCPLEGVPAHGIQVYKKVWLGLPTSGLHWKDAAWLAFGISMNAPSVSELHPDGVLIHTVSLDYPLSDYRSEVAALVMDGWLHQEFDIADSGAAVTYDAARERHVFTWGDIANPFSDAPS
jgi:hypothetical protein